MEVLAGGFSSTGAAADSGFASCVFSAGGESLMLLRSMRARCSIRLDCVAE